MQASLFNYFYFIFARLVAIITSNLQLESASLLFAGDYHSQGWINKLWQLAELRNKAGHASGEQLDKQQVFNQTQWLISWVKLFEKEI
jgi:hypothetical protein